MTVRAVVVGAPGSGKSTIGRRLAERLGTGFRDTDTDVEARAGKSISDVFTDDGEPAFRAMEEVVVAAALAEHDGVLALGGGAVLSSATRQLLGEYTVIFLNIGVSEGVKRTGVSTARPLLAGVNPRTTFKALLDSRTPVYREVATLEVSTDDRTPDEIVSLIVGELPERRAHSEVVGGHEEPSEREPRVE